MKDYRVDIRIKNNRLLQKIESAGFNSIKEFCKATGINKASVYSALNLKMPVYNRKFQLREVPKRLGEFFLCPPTELFPEEVWYEELEETTASVEMSADDIKKLSSNNISIAQLESAIDAEKQADKLLQFLPKRERAIMKKRHYDDMRLDEIADEYGVSKERIRQILTKSERKIRHGLKQ